MLTVEQQLQAHQALAADPACLHQFPREGREGLLAARERYFVEAIEEGRQPRAMACIALQRLFQYQRDYAYYHSLQEEPEIVPLQEAVSRACAYAAESLYLADKYQRHNTRWQLLDANTVSASIAYLMMMHCWDDVDQLVPIIINSLFKGQPLLIANSRRRLPSSLWFILALNQHANGIKTPILDAPAYQSLTLMPYQETLMQWKSEAPQIVNLRIAVLCEAHRELAQGGDIYNGFVDQLFPYEVLAWLALRKRHQLDTPSQYEHPLMNTPIVQPFLSDALVVSTLNSPPYIESLKTVVKESQVQYQKYKSEPATLCNSP